MISLSTDLLSIRAARLATRLWTKVDRTNDVGCWLWLGYKFYPNKNKKYGPYAMIYVDGQAKLAHRVVWELVFGHTDMDVRQTCGNTLCMRPTHLAQGSFRGKRRSNA